MFPLSFSSSLHKGRRSHGKTRGSFLGSCHHSHNSLKDRLNRYVVAGIKLGSCHDDALEPTQRPTTLGHIHPTGQWGGLVLIPNLDSNHKNKKVCVSSQSAVFGKLHSNQTSVIRLVMSHLAVTPVSRMS